METKKSEKCDLEGKRGIFRTIGLIIAMLSVLYAFRASHQVSSVKVFESGEASAIPDDFIPPTKHDEPKELILPPPLRLLDQITVVEDSYNDQDDFEFLTSEAGKEFFLIDIIPQMKKEDNSDSIFVVVENMPEFPGGEVALRRWLNSKVKYPDDAVANGVQGTVFVQFVIDKSGNVTNTKASRNVFPSLDSEALRVVGSMPKWKPGRQRGVPVNVSFTVPISFRLAE